MTRRVLLAVYEAPGLGGAATSAYALFRKMLGDGIDVHLVNMIDACDLPYVQYVLGETYGNPHRLPNVHSCVLDGSPSRRRDALARLVEAVAPEVILGYGDIAASLLKPNLRS